MTEQEIQQPKWLVELENRRRKPRLAHEAGAGSPCLTCSEACPGLDLHFWRKICKNCKCSRDEHDVCDDDFPQFDLLFGPNAKSKTRPTRLRVNINNKQPQNETTFEWIPPNTTKELAEDYMKALPEEKLPITGSAGEALRKQQLQKQVPLHDIDYKACDELTDQEKVEFERYLDNLKKCAGQGKVYKFFSAPGFQRNAFPPSSTQEDSNVENLNSNLIPNHAVVNLRTPSSFIPKISPPVLRRINTLPENAIHNPLNASVMPVKAGLGNSIETPTSDINSNPGGYSQALVKDRHDNIVPQVNSVPGVPQPPPEPIGQLTNSSLGRFHHALVKDRHDNIMPEVTSVPGVKHPPPESINQLNNSNPGGHHHGLVKDRHDYIMSEVASVPGIPHPPPEPISQLNNSNSGRYQHALVKDRHDNILPQVTSEIPNPPPELRSKLFEFDKNGFEKAKHDPDLERNNSDLIINSSIEGKLDKLVPPSQQLQSSISAELVEKMITRELLSPSPLKRADVVGSTLDAKRLNFIREKLQMQYASKEEPNGVPASRSTELSRPKEISALKTINEDVKRSSPYISKTESPNTMNSLIEEQNRQPAQIAQDINSNKTTAMPYNPVPFKGALDSYPNVRGQVINSQETNNPVFPELPIGNPVINETAVEQLQENMQGVTMNAEKNKSCHECKEKINCGDVVVMAEKAKDALWHPGCFVCSICNELLADLVYFYYKEKLYCGRDLATLLKIPRCYACDELIFVREYTVAEDHNYHLKHFCCWECDKPLAGQQYTPENDRPLCLPCYQSNYAKTCSTCNKIIAADQQGVCVKNLDFHVSDECFCCYECKKSLLNSRMMIKEDKPFCSKECALKCLH